jgi:type I restriction enzyme R subunit
VQARGFEELLEQAIKRYKLRVMIRRISRKYGYPPDMREAATETVMQQAELIAADWVK